MGSLLKSLTLFSFSLCLNIYVNPKFAQGGEEKQEFYNFQNCLVFPPFVQKFGEKWIFSPLFPWRWSIEGGGSPLTGSAIACVWVVCHFQFHSLSFLWIPFKFDLNTYVVPKHICVLWELFLNIFSFVLKMFSFLLVGQHHSEKYNKFGN